MGRAPCCDKANVKKGPWSPEEDAKLKSYIEKHGTGGNWIALPQKIGLKRCGKSCRLRWLNYLRPNIRHGGFSEEEDNIICNLYVSIGSRWSIIAAQLPGRTDNDVKNYWNTRLKKKLLGTKQGKDQHSNNGVKVKQDHMKRVPMISSDTNSNYNQNLHWPPQLPPIPFSNQEQAVLNDHSSIRKLLVKLGGRFSDDDQISCHLMNPQIPYNHQQIYDQPINISSSSTLTEALDNGNSQFSQTQHSLDWSGGLQMLQGQSNFPGEEIPYNGNLQRLDGLEFLLADQHDVLNSRVGTTSSGQTITGSLGDINSMIYPLVASNCERICGFDELRYTGSV